MKENRAARKELTLHGIDGESGRYDQPSLGIDELRELVRREEASRPVPTTTARPPVAQALREGVDPRRLEQAGWAAVFAQSADPAIRTALEPLLSHRRRQVGSTSGRRFRELTGRQGYRLGESKLRFLARQGAGPGPVDPDRFPYYVMLVGEPAEIPFSFQYELDVQYAVGRLCFESPEAYAAYAESVVVAETAAPRPRRAVFFGVRKEGDPATELCHDLLVEPLARRLRGEVDPWTVETVLGPDATKSRLNRLLGGAETPDLFFSACHGLHLDEESPHQRRLQGALVCQDWPGPDVGFDPSLEPPYFAADDVSDGAELGGLIAFFFACFSAGTPKDNNFFHRGGDEVEEIADRAFVAKLPQKLTGHPKGGALAVVGHIDRAWTFSFKWPSTGAQLEVFRSTLRRLMAGHPVGSAMEYFNQRFAELEVDLGALRRHLSFGRPADALEECSLWTARNDARNFVVLGDPAVRIGSVESEGS